MIITCSVLLLVMAVSSQAQIAWNGNWAMGCDFKGNDLSNALAKGAECGPMCQRTTGCTHFTWNSHNGGTCWMKKGWVSKLEAFVAVDKGMVCGIANGHVKWNGNWAQGCAFKGRDLSNAKMAGAQCGPTCDKTPGCTHFTWTIYNGGTCWMKSGAVSKTDCYYTGDKSVCGVAGNSLTQPKSQPQPKAPAQPKAPPQAQAPAQPKAQPQTQPNGNSVLVRFVNKMSQTIWVGLQGRSKANANWKLPFDGGFELPAGKMVEARFPLDLNAARFWGRTGCKNVNGLFKCETGNCDYLHCANGGVQRGGATPATLAEFTLNGHGDKDYYDISLVDGYNLPMSITPLNPSQGNAYWCKVAGCTSDLNRSCPSDLQKKNSNGQVVGCLSACERFKTDAYCCRGAHNLPSTCNPAKWPFNYASVFKKSCPAAYSYAYDDATSTFFCRNTGYTIQFG